MRFEEYLNEGFTLPSGLKGIWEKVRRELSDMGLDAVKKKSEKAWKDLQMELHGGQWDEYLDYIEDSEELKPYLKMMKDTTSEKRKDLYGESVVLSEDAKHWWELIKAEAFPTLAFLPALQVWIELDKMVRGTGGDTKVALFYAALWLVMMSGKYVSGWMKWKKENPMEYGQERSAGKGGII